VNPGAQSNYFYITLKDGHTINLQAQDDDTADMWICGIYKAINSFFQARDSDIVSTLSISPPPNFTAVGISATEKLECKEGFLQELASGEWTWKRRYIVLKNGFLFVYKTKPEVHKYDSYLHKMPLFHCEVDDYFPNKWKGMAIQVRNIREQVVLRGTHSISAVHRRTYLISHFLYLLSPL